MPEVLASSGSFVEYNKRNTLMGSFNRFMTWWYILIYLSYRLLLQFLVEVRQSWWSILYILIVDFNRIFYRRILTHLKTFMFETSFYTSLCWVLIWEFSSPSFSLSIFNRSVILSWLIIIALFHDIVHL